MGDRAGALGSGPATELAQASVDVAFDELGLREVVAFTLPDNVASRRVMEKAGLRYEREIVHVGLPHVLYAPGDGPPGCHAGSPLLLRSAASAPLTRSREARKEHVGSRHGRPRPR